MCDCDFLPHYFYLEHRGHSTAVSWLSGFKWARVCMQVCGDVPHPMSDGGGTLSQVQMGVPHPRSGWGYPILLTGGYPLQVWMGGTPSSWQGVPPSKMRMGVPHSADRGYPHPRSGWGGNLGYPPSKTRLDGVPPHPRLDALLPPSWGTPPSRTGWGTPTQDWMVYPPPQSKTGWGTPHPQPPVRRLISKASTCYVTGGVLLAFTQDFLVF